MILQRREFLKKLGYLMAGGLIVPYVPKVFYSFPKVDPFDPIRGTLKCITRPTIVVFDDLEELHYGRANYIPYGVPFPLELN